jgi:hypothetical protein
MGNKFNVVKKTKMKEDFEWVCKVLSHKENNVKHFQSLERIVELFKNKWDDGSKEFKLLYAFLKMFLKKTIKVKLLLNKNK